MGNGGVEPLDSRSNYFSSRVLQTRMENIAQIVSLLHDRTKSPKQKVDNIWRILHAWLLAISTFSSTKYSQSNRLANN